MVPIKTEIAGIICPQRDQDCTRIWSLLQQKFQALYISGVPFMNLPKKEMAKNLRDLGEKLLFRNVLKRNLK